MQANVQGGARHMLTVDFRRPALIHCVSASRRSAHVDAINRRWSRRPLRASDPGAATKRSVPLRNT